MIILQQLRVREIASNFCLLCGALDEEVVCVCWRRSAGDGALEIYPRFHHTK